MLTPTPAGATPPGRDRCSATRSTRWFVGISFPGQDRLPVFSWVTPANAADSTWAIPLLLVTVLLYGFEVWFVRADGAYFTWKILGFIHDVLGASPVVDPVPGHRTGYNVRRKPVLAREPAVGDPDLHPAVGRSHGASKRH
jgi:hypothetical protein